MRQYERRVAAVLAERGDNRRFTAQVQRDLAVALQALDEMRRTHARQLLETQTEVNIARDRIMHMERSAFWKLRNAWVRLSRRMGRES